MIRVIEKESADEQMKRLRQRKIYIQVRIPRVKAEIAAIASQKKDLSGSKSATRAAIDELIYSNQHLIVLRKELQALEQERKTVFKGLKELRAD